MDCGDVELLIFKKTDGAIEPEDEARLKGHLQACAACRREMEVESRRVRLYRTVLSAQPMSEPVSLPKDAPQTQVHPWPRSVRWLFSPYTVAAMMLMGVLLYAYDAWKREHSGTLHPADAGLLQSKGRIVFLNEKNEMCIMDPDGSHVKRLSSSISASEPVLSPDGTKIAYVGDAEIYIMDVDGSNVKKLTDSGARTPGWSPDGKKIFFVSKGGTNVMTVEGSNVTELGKFEGGSRDGMYAAWSPDGKHLAFSSRRDRYYEIFVMDVDGKNVRKLVDYKKMPASSFSWSPDGKRIAFDSTLGNWSYAEPVSSPAKIWGQVEIYVVDVDGSHLTRLTSNQAFDGCPVWSPDGRQIAFVSDRDGSKGLYVINADGSSGSQVKKLATTIDIEKYMTMHSPISWGPTPSPVGKNAAPALDAGLLRPRGRIAFVSDRDGNPEIYVMDEDGSNIKRLTTQGGSQPTWSPDGRKIAFVSKSDIFMMNADGSNLRNLTNDKASDYSPAWAPGGKEIAFVSNREGGEHIYVMKSDGSGVECITQEDGLVSKNADVGISWSPDGTKLCTELRSHENSRVDLFIIDRKGSIISNLTNTSGSEEASPAWSPDGKKVAFANHHEINHGHAIYVTDSDGLSLRVLTDGKAYDGDPAWSPDGKKIVFTSTRDTTGLNDGVLKRQIYIMDSDGSHVKRLSTGDDSVGDDYSPAWAPR